MVGPAGWGVRAPTLPFPGDQISAGAKNEGGKRSTERGVGCGGAEPGQIDGACVLPFSTEHHPKSLSITPRGWDSAVVGQRGGSTERWERAQG